MVDGGTHDAQRSFASGFFPEGGGSCSLGISIRVVTFFVQGIKPPIGLVRCGRKLLGTCCPMQPYVPLQGWQTS